MLKKILDFSKAEKGKGLKIVIPKQMLQKLPIAPVQVKSCNTSEKLQKEIPQIIYSLSSA